MVSPDNINAPPLSESPTKSQSAVNLRRLLKSSPQDLWLDTIRRTQGPQHDILVHWMLSQTECDFAVACHAFYRSNPAHYLDHLRPLPSPPKSTNIFAMVLLNWDTGFYRTHNLLVESIDANPRQIARINQKVMARPKGSLPFKIPMPFLHPIGGTPMRVPRYMSPDEARHIWPIYSDLGLSVVDAAPGMSRQLARAKSLIVQAKRRSGIP